MIGENVKKEIVKSRSFGEQLEGIIVSKGQFPMGDRNLLLILYWSLMFDYHKGILSLLQSGFFGAAFALMRPAVEAVIRAHVALKGSEGDLQHIRNDEYKVDFKRIGAKIDAEFGLDHLMEDFLIEARSTLHSYTHSGLLQLGRRCTGSEIKPDYKDDEIIEVIRVTTIATFMITNLVTKHFGFEKDWEMVGQMLAEWSKH